MYHVDPPVSRALVLVCEKCGRRLDSKSDENPSRRLVSRLKKQAKKLFAKREVRAVTTSCMDICPDGQVSVAIVTIEETETNTRFFTVAVDDIDATGRRILQRVKSSGR